MIGVKAFSPLLQLPGICCQQTITAIAEQNLSNHIEIKFFAIMTWYCLSLLYEVKKSSQ